MNVNLILVFFILNVGVGLAQLWIGAIYWALYKHQAIAVEILIRDGSLLLFGASLVASATYNVIPKPSSLKGRVPFFVLVATVMTLFLFTTGVMYGMELIAAQDATKAVDYDFAFKIHIAWASIAILYAFWITYITNGLQEERRSRVYI